MPKYKCINEECDNFGVIVTQSSISKIVGNSIVDTAIKCQGCEKDRILIPVDEMTTTMIGNNICKK